MAKPFYGGQAVIEGVMMKGPRNWSLAVRSPDDEIVTVEEETGSLTERYPILKRPFFRGIVVLVETLVLGIKTISLSANLSLGEEEGEITNKEMIATMAVAFALVVVLFMVLPIYLTRTANALIGNNFFFTIVEGFIRISIFVAYIAVISRLGDIQRVFQYHGAEHKTINAFEAGEALTAENAAKYSTVHVRCGTSLMLIVMVIAVFAFSFLPTTNILTRLGGKILLLPVVAGISYEVTRYAARHTSSAFMRIIMAPGLWLQRLTTKEPDMAQLEVAVVALKSVLRAEGQPIPGDADMENAPTESAPNGQSAAENETEPDSEVLEAPCAFSTDPT